MVNANGKCQTVSAMSQTREECCSSSFATMAWTPHENPSTGQLFQWQFLIGGAPECQACHGTRPQLNTSPCLCLDICFLARLFRSKQVWSEVKLLASFSFHLPQLHVTMSSVKMAWDAKWGRASPAACVPQTALVYAIQKTCKASDACAALTRERIKITAACWNTTVAEAPRSISTTMGLANVSWIFPVKI